MADISTVVSNFFTIASETFTDNLSSSITALAVTVPVNSAVEYAIGDAVALTVDPGTVNEATFIGKKDTGNQFIECIWTEGNLAVGHSAGATIIDYDSATHHSAQSKGIKQQHTSNGAHGAITATSLEAPIITKSGLTIEPIPSGSIFPTALRLAPIDWLLCFGQAISRSTYAALFNAIVPSLGTFTVTIATPAVVTKVGHGLLTGDQVYLTTTGSLPTGLSINTLYYVVKVDADTFNLATSRANAVAGTKIATSGSQSGTHTLRDCPYGLGDGTTTFNIPDLRGRVLAGTDGMGGTAASRLTLARSEGSYGQLGANGGAETHVLTVAELAAHTHGYDMSSTDTSATGSNRPMAKDLTVDRTGTTLNAGSNTAHNNLQPTAIVSYIIRT